MRAIRKFDEFIREGIVKEQSPNNARAEYLNKEANTSYKFLQKKIISLGINEESANDYIKSCYDIIMELIRAKMLQEGYNASGRGAHEAEVSYLREIGFSEKDVQQADQLRYFRNGMLYYGKTFDEEYAETIIRFTKNLYSKLSP